MAYTKETGVRRDDWVRLLIHLPWGLLAAALLIPNPLIGITAFWGEIAYEGFNDWRKGDKSYKDVLGIVDGFLLGAFAAWALGWLGA